MAQFQAPVKICRSARAAPEPATYFHPQAALGLPAHGAISSSGENLSLGAGRGKTEHSPRGEEKQNLHQGVSI